MMMLKVTLILHLFIFFSSNDLFSKFLGFVMVGLLLAEHLPVDG